MVVAVKDVDEKPDPSLDYRIVFDLTFYAKADEEKENFDSSSINWGIADIGRIMNLHVTAGIPTSRLDFVVAVHAEALPSFLNEETYQKKYRTSNPNVKLIKELSDAGIKFLVCGQSLTWMGYAKSDLVPQAKVTLTAQTTLSQYQLKGYALKQISSD